MTDPDLPDDAGTDHASERETSERQGDKTDATPAVDRPTTGIVTVGDELLAGETTDTNAAWLGREIADRGGRVGRITTVPDEVDAIVGAVQRHRDAFDRVIVTGGLGPTPDDVTMTAVAAAVGSDLEPSPPVERDLAERGYAAADLAPETAAIPASAEPIHNPAGVAPGCHVAGVYVLPGVPEELRATFAGIAGAFAGPTRHTVSVETAEPESALLDRIATAADRFDVEIGSYPGDRVRLRVRGDDPDAVADAADWLRDHVDR